MIHEEQIDCARAVRIEDEIARRGIKLRGGVDRCGPCPVCGGTDRFSINLKKRVWNCRGCSRGGDVIALVQFLDKVDFMAAVETLAGEQFKSNSAKKTYFDYRDEYGAVIYQVERTDYGDGRKKTFKQRRSDGNGGWIDGPGCMKGVPRVPYRLPELIEALAHDRMIAIVEGERKADLLWSWNFPATCNSGGSGDSKIWAEHARDYFHDANVVIMPDNDPAGRAHMDTVAVCLRRAAASVRQLDLPIGEKGDIIDWAAWGGTREQLDALIENTARPWTAEARPNGEAQPGQAKDEAPPSPIVAKPYIYRDPRSIPPRQFLHAGHYIRGFLSATVAPGGLGKTSLQLVEAVGMAIGRDLLKGITSPRKLKAWYWNLEDPRDEIDRRISAIILHYDINPSTIEEQLFINSEEQLVIATRIKDATVVAEPVVNGLISEINRLQIDALIVDPFVSSHKVPENDNNAIDTVAKTWSGMGRTCNCAVEVAHHIRKPASGSTAEITVDDARGAGSLKDAGRSVRVLNTMSKEEAESVGIKPDQRKRYFRVEAGKANMKPPAENIDWRKIVSVPLDNATLEDEGDWVGVVTTWKMPGALDGLATSDLLRVQKRVDEGEWRENQRADDWVGRAVAEALGLDLDEPAVRKRVSSMLKIWIANGSLKIVTGVAKNRHERKFVKVGEWAV